MTRPARTRTRLRTRTRTRDVLRAVAAVAAALVVALPARAVVSSTFRPTPAEVLAPLRARMDDLRACARRFPTTVEATLSFRIDEHGRAQDLSYAGDDVAPGLAQCTTDVVRSVVFPRGAGKRMSVPFRVRVSDDARRGPSRSKSPSAPSR